MLLRLQFRLPNINYILKNIWLGVADFIWLTISSAVLFDLLSIRPRLHICVSCSSMWLAGCAQCALVTTTLCPFWLEYRWPMRLGGTDPGSALKDWWLHLAVYQQKANLAIITAWNVFYSPSDHELFCSNYHTVCDIFHCPDKCTHFKVALDQKSICQFAPQ